MISLFYNIIEFILRIIRWDIQYYCISERKVKKAKKWLKNHLHKISQEQGLNVKIVDNIWSENEEYIIRGQYYYNKKIVLNKNSFYTFNIYITWMHELAHHFVHKVGIECHDEKKIDEIVLSIIKTFPAWVINTLKLEICSDFYISKDNFMKQMELTYYGILKSEIHEK